MMNFESLNNNKSITDIYYVANTPSYLYRMLRNNFLVQNLSQLPTKELIQEFSNRASKPIKRDSEIAAVYAIFVALTLKEIEEVKSFFESAKSIKFEWFSDIASFFLEGYKPTPDTFSIQPTQNQQTGTIIIPTG